jgi:hypothetical protein
MHESAQLRREIVKADPHNMNSRRRLFLLNYLIAEVYGNPLYLNLGDPAAAEPYAHEAMRETERMAAEDRGSDRSVRDRMFGSWIVGCVLLPREPRRALPYLEAALAAASAQAKAAEGMDMLHDETSAQAQEALGRALLATGDRRRGLELLRTAALALEQLSSQAPQFINFRTDMIRAANRLGDILPAAEAAEWYRKAFAVAETFPASPRNVRELMGRAEVNLRWSRWNATAPAAERRRRLEIAAQSWAQLASYAPANRPIQAALAEARRLLTQVQ